MILSSPGRYDLVGARGIRCGYSFSRTFTLTVGGVAVNLTGYTAQALLYRDKKDNTAVSTLTLAIDALNGEISWELTPTQTDALPAIANGWYSLNLTNLPEIAGVLYGDLAVYRGRPG